MTVQISIPTATEPLELELSVGETLFVLGANGSGKSNLMHRLYGANARNARWIAAHRQTWFPTNIVEMSTRARWDTERNIQQEDQRPRARWTDNIGISRLNIALFDLIQKQNLQDREIAAAVRAGDSAKAEELAKQNEYPLDSLNELLSQANLPISTSLSNREEIWASKNGSEAYSIAEASDGERNVILIASEVLTVPPGTLILIDEPERHLHRSIVSPILTGLFTRRKDCIFVISTHDVGLASDNSTSRILLVRNCAYQGNQVATWDADLVKSTNDIDEDLKKDILGARRDVLFVEGEISSLDMPLYSVIFPNVSVIPKGSRKNVEDAVQSIRTSENLHWIRAFGIVDDDDQDPDKRDELERAGIYSIAAYSVESIYYDLKVQEAVAKRRAALTGDDEFALQEKAKSAALDAFGSSVEHFAKRKAEGKLRSEVLKQLPNRNSPMFDQPLNIVLDAPSTLMQERALLEKAIEEEDIETIIRRYPIRETQARKVIAEQLGFSHWEEYEKAVVQLLRDDADMLMYVRELLGGVSEKILAHAS